MARRTRKPSRPRATTGDIVTSGSSEPRISSKWRKYYRRLVGLRQALEERRSELSRAANETPPAFSMHMGDAGTDEYDRDFALGILSSEQDAVYEIDNAIARIRDGVYGKCELTGKPIEAARLEAIPWTRFSAAAEKTLEREGAAKRASLGPRQTVLRSSPGSEAPEEGDSD